MASETLDSVPGARAAAGRMTFDGEVMDFSGGLIGGLDPADFSIVAPRIGSMSGVVGVCLDGAQWALPARCRVSPGRGVLCVIGPDESLHVLVAHRGRMRELAVSVGFAAALRRHYFDRG